MKVAKGIEMLTISVMLGPGPSTVHPTVIWDQDAVILVDTGFPGILPVIRETMEEAGIAYDQLTHVIMTHHDIDHIGSLAAILREIPRKVQVLAHQEETPYIQGDAPPVKINSRTNVQMEQQLKHLSEDKRQAILSVFKNFKSYTAPVDQTLIDGDTLPCCGGILVIHTPGHTPGHICLYHRESKTLIAGDALFIENGILVPTPSYLNDNNKDALRSLGKLTHIEIENIICYHGGLYKNHGGRFIADLVENNPSS